MNKVAVLQSNYIPWKGYFDIINDVDVFVFYDDVQFTKNDWRNRNKIKTNQGASWITVPAGQNLNRLICEVRLDEGNWAAKHYKTLLQYYSKAPCFHQYRDFIEHVYLERKWQSLSELNIFLITTIAQNFLGIKTVFKDSRQFDADGKKHDRLLDLLKKVGSKVYVSGPSARNYINDEDFSKNGIKLIYKDYFGYPEYKQFHPPFDHYVSILDLLFHTGSDAPDYIWGWRN